ncbi:MAG: FAD-dependent oxidoreductase [Candidatus Micrarchaeia archaeon]
MYSSHEFIELQAFLFLNAYYSRLNGFLRFVVCGGGPAGIGAALSASKLGMRVAIIEKSSLLGGNWTNGYVLSSFFIKERYK